MRSLDPKYKLKAVREIIDAKKSYKDVCGRFGISRQILYLWVKKYQAFSKKGAHALKNKYIFRSHHPKKTPWQIEKKILDLTVKNPDFSVHSINKELAKSGIKISLHGVHNILVRYNLQTREMRHRFSLSHPVKTVFAQALNPTMRAKLVEEYVHGGKPIAKVCKLWNISRPTFYAWLGRYKKAVESQEGLIDALSGRYRRGEDHHRSVSNEIKEAILALVRTNPQLSAHKIYEALPKTDGRPICGHHAVQNVLFREGLSTFPARLRFAGNLAPEPQPLAMPESPEPVGRLSAWRLLNAPYMTVPRWIAKHPKAWPITLPPILFVLYILEFDKLLRPTYFFPFIALLFGFIFFMYSLKYYISLIIVMRLAQEGQGKSRESKVESQKGIKGVLARLGSFLKPKKPIAAVNPLLVNLDKVQLTAEPFVSIHVAIYNEKKVIERLIAACTSQEWANYELVIVDDSTDETTELALKQLRSDNRHLTKAHATDELEVYTSTKPGAPTIKLIHRFSRSGFKGAALQKALENTDSRAQFVTIFDSDFVPYPDTLSQFAKTFQEACGGLDNIKNSNIAAVQGYQWHVLNKSQNWVTRGVRTEYAGSYVIERAGIGVYGGLNMIAGSVFAIRADVLRHFGWGTSITEDLQLTLKLYEAGFKVVFTPYIQAPAEAVSTIKRLIRQRMRWAEGHTYNVKKMWKRLLLSRTMSQREKFEFVYLAPYYLQATLFLVGSLAWFLSEIVFKVRLPFWTAAWGWSLVFVNFLSLPLMNLVGLFLEESEEKDYLGIASFLVLSYILVPFQAYAAVKALLEDREGPWFRTPKTGNITDAFSRVYFYKFFEKFKSLGKGGTSSAPAFTPVFSSAFNRFGGYNIKVKRSSFVSRGVLAVLLISVMFINYLAFFVPQTEARHSATHLEQQANIQTGRDPYSTTSTTSAPTDDSLGLVKYDASSLSNETAYFEAVIKLTGVDVGSSLSMDCLSATDCKIAYYDATVGDLKFIDCDNATCSSNSGVVTVDGCSTCNTNGDTGQNTAIDCISATECKIAYYITADTAIKFLSCVDGADGDSYPCNASAERTYSKLDGHASGNVLTGAVTGIVGNIHPISMTCPSATNCKLLYNDLSGNDLIFADCADTNCSTGERNIIGADIGSAVRGDLDCRNGSADCKVVYFPVSGGTLGLVFRDCSVENCTTADATTTLVSGSNYGQPSIECLTATTCRISVNDVANSDLEFVECNADADCSANNGFDLLDGGSSCLLTSCSTTDSPGNYTNMYCVAADNCKIAYYETSSKNLKFADCAANDCNSGTVTTVESANDVGSYPVVNCVGGDTDCKIAFYEASNGNLKFFDCGDATCTSGSGISTVIDYGIPSGTTATATLFPSGGGSTAVTCGAGTAEVTSTNEFYTRVRTSCSLSLTDANFYTARLKTSNATYAANMRAARVIYIQDPGAGNVTQTQTSVEVGTFSTLGNTTYTEVNGPWYCYDSDDNNGTGCSDTTGSNFNPAPTAYFEATLKIASAGDTAHAELVNASGTQVAEVSRTGATTFALARDTTVTLTAGNVYRVRVKCTDGDGGGCSMSITNAHIILDQSDNTNGITDLETIQMYNNTQLTGSGGSATVNIWDNQFTRNNLQQNGQTVTYYFEGDFSNSNCPKQGGCVNNTVALYNNEDFSTISSSSVVSTAQSQERKRSADLNSNLPSAGTSKNLTPIITWPGGGQTGFLYKTWLIIQINNLQVPEYAILIAPFAVFIPKIAKKISLWRRRRKKLILVSNL